MTRHLAEFNFGTLRYSWDDPRLADFQNGLDQVNAIGARSPGSVWRMPDDVMEAAQEDPRGPLADRPNTASTLSVWTGPGRLYRFAMKTLHARFMARNDEWFVPGDRGYLVCWWVPIGHRPDVAEGMARWNELQAQGETENVFGSNMLADLAARETA
ncbi:DUF3291 domain-containing protein [Cognatiyoonia sp. IB215446]|uniref:DUF3291 domain-containing protein n=1 Tax=Cognatiyoonia sp. IB215446 TaxID=3097355 RepID=UPI002A0DCF11|nr:DUF3291 domain-containing protein [Cognatiyoonia sp. IB215446]MDX8349547.1 DUF3291 domain-containing protein [Cognatiyoonia sp. IB215446]